MDILFSGIIQEIGQIIAISTSTAGKSDGLILNIQTSQQFSQLSLGESICVNGVCLTVIKFSNDNFMVEICNETLLKTNFNQLKPGYYVNLEKSLKLNDGISGHLVSGHVDYVACVYRIETDGFSTRLGFVAPIDIDPFIVPKGSIAINGVSLTIVNVDKVNEQVYFDIALIPHTLNNTNLGKLALNDTVNLETDLIARHLVKITATYLTNLVKPQTCPNPVK